MKKFNEMVGEVTSTKPKEMSQADFKKVDFKPLLAEIKKICGIAIPLEFKLDIGRRGTPVVRIESPELISKCGILKSIYKSVRIDVFGSRVDKDRIWIAIHVWYQFHNGDTNGASIIDANYDVKTKKWSFI